MRILTQMAAAALAISLSAPLLAQTLDKKLEKVRIDLGDVQVGLYGMINTAKASVRSHPEGALLLWEERSLESKTVVSHITPLNTQLARSGPDIVLRNEWLADAVYLPQERAIVALTHTLVSPNTYIEDYPNFLHLVKMDLTGRILWRTTVCGAHSQGAEDRWPDFGGYVPALGYNGRQFAVYTSLMRDFAAPGAKKDVHQIDLFKAYDLNGKELPQLTRELSVSHSNQVHVAANAAGDWVTTTVGDGGPYGIVAFNRTTGNSENLYGKEVNAANTGTYPDGCGSVLCAGYLNGMVGAGNRFWAAVSHTMREQPMDYGEKDLDILLLTFDDTPALLKKTWLTTNREQVRESKPYLAHYGKQELLVGWNLSDDQGYHTGMQLMRLNREGKVLEGPVNVDANTATFAVQFQTLPDGSVIWAHGEERDNFPTLYRVQP